jgi:hypothetical protein
MDQNRIRFDARKRKLYMLGTCLELSSLCDAMCCREWGIRVSPEEFASGRYRTTTFCMLTDEVCEKQVMACINRRYELKKTADGACVYLGNDNRCTIYQTRPQVCRDFSCQGGWLLTSASSVLNDRPPSAKKTGKDDFIQRITDDMTFVPHPLTKLHTVFYVPEKGEITFLKEIVGTCGRFYSRDTVPPLPLNDDRLIILVRLFDDKLPLYDIRQRFCAQYPPGPTREDFYEIIWLLNKHNIIIEARNFRGMLSRIGRI